VPIRVQGEGAACAKLSLTDCAAELRLRVVNPSSPEFAILLGETFTGSP
jgi:hypothetical protein